MSWIFGVKPPSPPSSGDEIRDQENFGGEKPPQKPPSDGAKMAYSFDSTALERAAKAAKELEKSSKKSKKNLRKC